MSKLASLALASKGTPRKPQRKRRPAVDAVADSLWDAFDNDDREGFRKAVDDLARLRQIEASEDE